MESSTTNIQETSKISLEARLGLISLNAAASGFMTYGIVELALRGNYAAAAVIAVFDVLSASSVYYNSKTIIETYKQ